MKDDDDDDDDDKTKNNPFSFVDVSTFALRLSVDTDCRRLTPVHTHTLV